MKCEICYKEIQNNKDYLATIKTPLALFERLFNPVIFIWFISGQLYQKLDKNISYIHSSCFLSKYNYFERLFYIVLAGGLSPIGLKESTPASTQVVPPSLTRIKYKIMPLARVLIGILLISVVLSWENPILTYYSTIIYIILTIIFIFLVIESYALYKANSYLEKKFLQKF